jgi:hypothetical protein
MTFSILLLLALITAITIGLIRWAVKNFWSEMKKAWDDL